MQKKSLLTLMAGILVISAVLFGSFAISNVYAQGPTPNRPAAQRLGFGTGDDSYLAEALGLTEEEILAARTEAFDLALEQAVSEDLITQSQADSLASRTPGLGWGLLYNMIGRDNADLIDEDALFAEALGISVEDLQAARQSTMSSRLDDAVAAGGLTQEQADAMAAHQALMQDSEFQAQVQEGLQAAVQAAVEAGKLTQAQADALLAQMQTRFGQMGAFGGMFGRFGAGQPGMMQGGMFGGMQGGQGMFGGMQGGNMPGGRGGMNPGGRGGFGSGFCDGTCFYDNDND